MRISSGEFRGRVLRTPRGDATRPTSGLVRETLFNILTPLLPDARFLDLFAGCGSVGLEALSRGAAQATFVENGRPALDCLRGNIEMLQVGDVTNILPYPVSRGLEQIKRRGEVFDLIFLDPPFAQVENYRTVLDTLASGPVLADGGIVIAQHDTRVSLPEKVGSLLRYRLREMGDNALSFYRREE